MLAWADMTTGHTKHMEIARQAYEHAVEIARDPTTKINWENSLDVVMEHFWGCLYALEQEQAKK